MAGIQFYRETFVTDLFIASACFVCNIQLASESRLAVGVRTCYTLNAMIVCEEEIQMLLHVIEHTIHHSIGLLPFLFVTYLIMEYIEHKAGKKTEQMVKRSGKCGPLIGGVLGIVPQCGFSAAASNLYAGRIVTLGTLLAVFLSTSDEMLPILISAKVEPVIICKILGIKVLIGVVAGFLTDIFLRKKFHGEEDHLKIDHMCEHGHCHCDEGKIGKSALVHTLQIFFFIVVITFVLNLLIEFVGEETLAGILSGKPVIGPLLAGIVGLIPNCAASVLITQLYLEGMLGAGAMMAGLLVGAGVGILVLFRVNDDTKENLKVTALLYTIGVLAGIIIEIAGLKF